MAKQVLPVNFKDDLLAESMNGKRKYRMIDNDDGTISLEDVSEYLQTGSTFGAGQINSTNQAVNDSVDKDKILKTLEEVRASTDSDAVVGAGAVAELNKNIADNAKYLRLQSRNSKATNGRHILYGEMSGSTPRIGYDYCADPNDATTRTDFVRVSFDGKDFYAEGKKAGADAVLKKLGEPTLTTGGDAASYTIPNSGKAIIFYTASFYNREGATHNGNGGSYTIKLGSTTLDSGSRDTPNSKDGFGFNGVWIGDVTKGQVVTISTSTGGWIRATNVYMRIVTME